MLRKEIKLIKEDRTKMFKEMSIMKSQISEGETTYKFNQPKLDKKVA